MLLTNQSQGVNCHKHVESGGVNRCLITQLLMVQHCAGDRPSHINNGGAAASITGTWENNETKQLITEDNSQASVENGVTDTLVQDTQRTEYWRKLFVPSVVHLLQDKFKLSSRMFVNSGPGDSLRLINFPLKEHTNSSVGGVQ